MDDLCSFEPCDAIDLRSEARNGPPISGILQFGAWKALKPVVTNSPPYKWTAPHSYSQRTRQTDWYLFIRNNMANIRLAFAIQSMSSALLSPDYQAALPKATGIQFLRRLKAAESERALNFPVLTVWSMGAHWLDRALRSRPPRSFAQQEFNL